jgi:hypothetical protein
LGEAAPTAERLLIRPFDCFVGVDWSGDKNKWQKGLKIAMAHPGYSAPELVAGRGPQGKWSRSSAVDWVIDRARSERVLIGLDFCFGFPECEVELDWNYLEQLCSADENFYGGTFFRKPGTRHCHLINSRWLPRADYRSDRLRITERAASRVVGATPQSLFNAVGPAQVGPSSISGMRVLYSLRGQSSRISIWPFDDIDDSRSVIVEVFPRYFPLLHKLSPKLSEHKALNSALAAFDSAPVTVPPASEDEGDALVTAAALRALSKDRAFFNPPDDSVRRQGWIFGVPLGDSM